MRELNLVEPVVYALGVSISGTGYWYLTKSRSFMLLCSGTWYLTNSLLPNKNGTIRQIVTSN